MWRPAPVLMAIGCLAFGGSQLPQSSAETRCELELRVTDALAVPIREVSVAYAHKGVKHMGPMPRSIPCDVRSLSVYSPGLRRKEVRPHLRLGHTLEIVQLYAAELGGGQTTFQVHFEVQGVEQEERCDAIRVVSLLDPALRWDAAVSAGRHFSLQAMPLGYYGFVLLGKRGVCGTTTMELLDKPKARVPLSMLPPGSQPGRF